MLEKPMRLRHEQALCMHTSVRVERRVYMDGTETYGKRFRSHLRGNSL